jgi:Cu/Ag efflux pump CusA
VALSQVARVLDTTGPNVLNREGVQRRVVVSCNVHGRDLAAVVADIQRETASVAEGLRGRAGEYRIEYGGQFEAQRQANLRLLLLGTLAVVGVLLLLTKALESWRAALQVLANVPLAAIGSIVALLLTNRPEASALHAAPWWQLPAVWLGATNLSLAHWVGFITLVGIVSRNGILMVSHYLHLMRHEGERFDENMIVRGSLERLAPVLMTAGVAVIGLLPLATGAGQTGKEILHPLAVVVIGGLVASTLLDQLVTPALFYTFGRKVSERLLPPAEHYAASERLAASFAAPQQADVLALQPIAKDTNGPGTERGADHTTR